MRGVFLTVNIFLIHLLFLVIPSIAQSDYMFNHITVEDGLTTNNIRCFIQDYYGFIWIGTENGLHRYDGYEYKVYFHDRHDPKSIGGNFIMSLYEDSDKNLWIGTLEGGASMYDRQSDAFITFSPNTNDSTSIAGQSIGYFFEDNNDRFWLTTEQGSVSFFNKETFDPKNPVFTNIMLPQEFLKSGNLWVSNMIQKNDHQYWVGVHGGGLVVYDLNTNSYHEEFDDSSFPFYFDRRIRGLYKDSKDRLWILSWGRGLYLYLPEEQRMINYTHDRNNSNGLPNNLVTSVLEDRNGTFWVGTDNGLCIMNDFDEQYPVGKFKILVHDPFDEWSLSSNAVKPIYEDNEGRLWVGTHLGGANIYDPEYFRFTSIRRHPVIEGTLPGNNVTAIVEDNDGGLWIGTDNNGLCYLSEGHKNLKTNNYQPIPLKNSVTGTFEQKIKTLAFDSQGYLWIGTWGGGLFKYHPDLGQVKHYYYNLPNQLLSESILSLAIDSNDIVWIASFSGGLARLDPKTDKFSYYRHDMNDTISIGNDKVNTLLIDKDNQLWIGTEGGGLNLLDKKSNKINRISIGNLLSAFTVISLYQCHNGFIWIGTHSNGLFRFDQSNNELKQYTTEFGMAENLVQSIHEDINNYLWISSNQGISKFVFSNNEVVHFSVEEGLQSKQFNPNAVMLSADGTMIFGGVKGMNAFLPQEIFKSEAIPNVVFTNFWLDNQLANHGTHQSPLEESLTVLDEIKLKHYQNSFSVQYAALEYDFAKRTRYFTYLENFDDLWLNRGTERKITYTNMPPGEYTLRVKAVNKDGFIADRDVKLKITISPAWYQTKLFWVLLFLTITGLTYSIIQLRINFFKKQSRKLESIVSLRTKELHEKSNEIQAQNEELTAQNDQILEQREELELARDQLTKMNTGLEKLVKDRTKKLEKTVTELDRFVYSASHDLSAPLKSILGLLNIAKIDKDNTRTQEYLNYMEDSILKLEDVIKSLISYSRNSRLDIKKEKIFLHELVKSILNELAYLSSTSYLHITVDIPEDQVIETDRQRLKIILHNLISNSIKYADLEKPKPTINISSSLRDQKIRIKIFDNGIGIEKQQQKKIFSMFYRATEQSSGSGLGLFIVKETLASVKGKIKVASVPGEESEFIVTIPE